MLRVCFQKLWVGPFDLGVHQLNLIPESVTANLLSLWLNLIHVLPARQLSVPSLGALTWRLQLNLINPGPVLNERKSNDGDWCEVPIS